MSPRGSLATQSPLDDPHPPTTPDMVDVAAHLAIQPSGKFCTTRQGLRARRACRQHDLASASIDKADSTSQMSKSRKNTQKMEMSATSLPALARRPIHRLMR
jgi:hypothetical protein